MNFTVMAFSAAPISQNLSVRNYIWVISPHAVAVRSVWTNRVWTNVSHGGWLSPSTTITYLFSYPGYFREPHWFSMGLPENIQGNLTGMPSLPLQATSPGLGGRKSSTLHCALIRQPSLGCMSASLHTGRHAMASQAANLHNPPFSTAPPDYRPPHLMYVTQTWTVHLGHIANLWVQVIKLKSS